MTILETDRAGRPSARLHAPRGYRTGRGRPHQLWRGRAGADGAARQAADERRMEAAGRRLSRRLVGRSRRRLEDRARGRAADLHRPDRQEAGTVTRIEPIQRLGSERERGASAAPSRAPVRPNARRRPGLDLGQHLGHRDARADVLDDGRPDDAPSATEAMARACSGVLIPKPTMIGRSVDRLIRATSGATSVAWAAAAPVIPVIET